MNNTNTAETMRFHIEAFKSSGITAKAYCLKHEIKHSVYYYWLKKLQPPSPHGKFIRVAPAVSASPVSIVFTNGNRISFEAMPPVEYLKQLLN